MNKFRQALIVAISAALVAIAFWSCDAGQTLSGNYNVYGSAVNVKTGSGLYSGLSNASVTLTNLYNASLNYSTSIDSNGNFSLSGIPGGKYKMTGSSSSVTFIPVTAMISGANTTLPDMLAFPKGAPNELTIVMAWENTNINMDLSMTYGGVYGGGGPNPNYLLTGTISQSNWTATKVRTATGSSTNKVEAIVLSVSGSNNESFRFYVNSFGTPSGTTGDLNFPNSQEPAGVTVYVFHGDTEFGEIPAAYNTADTILRMASIVIAGTTFTIGADMESQTDLVYRGLGIPQFKSKPVANFY